MSKYTTEVRFICESLAGLKESMDGNAIDVILNLSKDKIFDEYPIFDEHYRGVLNAKILKHYYTREICAETFGLWKLWLNNTMNEIMPYYNQLYKSALLEFNPLYDTEINITRDSWENGSNTNRNDNTRTENTGIEDKSHNETDSKGSSHNLNKFSDTPQGGITGMEVEENMYLTNATINDGNNTGHAENDGTNNRKINGKIKDEGGSTGSFNTLKDYTERVAGKRGGVTYSKMLTEFRQTFLNIDMMIINELADLFFKLY